MATHVKPTLVVEYEDQYLAVVNKPAGLVVHPGAGAPVETLVDQLAERWPELSGLERAGLVHRLDKDTSGLLLVAKTAEIQERLRHKFASRAVGKEYRALVHGTPAQPRGVIDIAIARHPTQRQRMAVAAHGKAAQTTYEVVSSVSRFSLLKVSIASGRTHQIRVHLKALGHPVVGDATYGSTEPGLGRQFLHASRLEFRHPVNDEPVTITSYLPPELHVWLRKMGIDE